MLVDIREYSTHAQSEEQNELPGAGVLLRKLIVTHLVKNSPLFIRPENPSQR